MNALRLVLPAIILSFGFLLTRAAADEPGYNMWFAGQIVSLDARRGTLRIARGPTETAGPGIETCTMIGRPLRRLRDGMEVEAEADTRRRPWRILHMRVFEFKALRKTSLGRRTVAARSANPALRAAPKTYWFSA